MTTLLFQIESLLNLMSNHPTDLLPLLHFLNGGTAAARYYQNWTTVVQNDHNGAISTDIGHHPTIMAEMEPWLFGRASTALPIADQDRSTPKVDDLVVIMDDLTPPGQVKMARTRRLHPGPDAISRVATVISNSGVLIRAYHRLCPLPVDQQA